MDLKKIENIDYVSGITIIDTEGTILFTVKFNSRFNVEEQDEVIGENVLRIFPNLSEKTSTLLNAIETGKPTYKQYQQIMDFRGKQITTTNVSLPIRSNGIIVGAVDLSKETNEVTQSEDVIKLDKIMFKNDYQLKAVTQPEKAKYTFEHIVTKNKKMNDLIHFAKKISKSTSSVLIYGETGTGKELFAQSIHNHSNRSEKPFIAQNCAALPENLIDSLLFGTKKGSFTGAEDQPGLFELADNGTLFLDEIHTIPLHLQAKLLRVLEEGCIRRLGDKRTRQINVRVLAATNKSPIDCINDNQLRLDLYYRLCVMPLYIPPLRERKDDILFLLKFFLDKHKEKSGKQLKHISKEVYEAFLDYKWPGNVRELEHVAEYALNRINESEDTLTINHVKDRIQLNVGKKDVNIRPLKEAVAEVESELIKKAMEVTKGNVSRAANILKIPRQTLQNKLDRYDIFIDMPKR